ncbi:MAG: ABC transporter permease subunit [Nitrospirae bacterium]|nr:MAG: ABC transporter permease subunit [Nitrospirota bacterium]
MKPRRHLAFALVFMAVSGAGLPMMQAHAEPQPTPIVIGSKNFLESRLLAEIFAQLIETHTALPVQRRFGLAGTQLCFEALKRGAIDMYPEYTGTGLVSILGLPPLPNPRAVLNRVRSEFLHRWNLWWLSPLGFENAYALAVPRRQAEALGLRTLSDLARVAQTLTAGFGYEFLQRPDGLPGLQRRYGLTFQHVRAMQQTLKYRAAAAGNIDVLDVYTTDGRLAVYDLVVLEDDKRFFPPYEAAGVIRGETLDRHPELGKVLGLLTNAFDVATMRRLNFRLQEKGESVEQVARDALRSLGLESSTTPAVTPNTSSSPDKSLVPYMWANRERLVIRAGEHLGLTGIALILGIVVAVPLGLLLERRRTVAEPVIRIIGTVQTIPSIALLAFMIPIFGVGALPAILALWMYSLFPIVRNTYSGLRDAAPAAVEAARALGMTEWQLLWWVRFPLAAPVMMAGVRTSAVITVGTATLAAFIGAGGLGVPIVSGLQMANTTIVLSGALPAALLALAVDGILGLVERWIRPPGLPP